MAFFSAGELGTCRGSKRAPGSAGPPAGSLLRQARPFFADLIYLAGPKRLGNYGARSCWRAICSYPVLCYFGRKPDKPIVARGRLRRVLDVSAIIVRVRRGRRQNGRAPAYVRDFSPCDRGCVRGGAAGPPRRSRRPTGSPRKTLLRGGSFGLAESAPLAKCTEAGDQKTRRNSEAPYEPPIERPFPASAQPIPSWGA